MYTGSGGGQVEFSGGTLIIGTGGATFDFPQGLFQWTGGTITLQPGRHDHQHRFSHAEQCQHVTLESL